MVNDPVSIEVTGLSEDCFARCQRAIANCNRAQIIWESYFQNLNGTAPNPTELHNLVALICSVAGV